jgi:hypothetical protein
MGHRASYVIVRGGEPRIYSSRFGALTVGRDMFAGPEDAVEFIESLTPDDQLYSTTWCEGGVFLDEDARTLLLFGDDGDGNLTNCLPLRRAYLLLLAERWPGWTVEWAHQGVEDFELRLGIAPGGDRDPPRPMTEREVERARESIGMSASSGWPYERTAADRLPCDCDEVEETFITVVGEDDGVRDVISPQRPTDLLRASPQLLEWLDAAPPAPPTTELHVRGCMLVDLRGREIECWEAEPLTDHELSRFTAFWPGWRFTRQTIGLVHQLERTGRDGSAARVPESRMMELAATMIADRTSGYGMDAVLAARVAQIAARPDVVAVAADPRPHEAAAPDPTGERTRGWLATLLGKIFS